MQWCLAYQELHNSLRAQNGGFERRFREMFPLLPLGKRQGLGPRAEIEQTLLLRLRPILIATVIGPDNDWRWDRVSEMPQKVVDRLARCPA